MVGDRLGKSILQPTHPVNNTRLIQQSISITQSGKKWYDLYVHVVKFDENRLAKIQDCLRGSLIATFLTLSFLNRDL